MIWLGFIYVHFYLILSVLCDLIHFIVFDLIWSIWLHLINLVTFYQFDLINLIWFDHFDLINFILFYFSDLNWFDRFDLIWSLWFELICFSTQLWREGGGRDNGPLRGAWSQLKIGWTTCMRRGGKGGTPSIKCLFCFKK